MTDVPLDPYFTESLLLSLLRGPRPARFYEPAGVHLDPESLKNLHKIARLTFSAPLVSGPDGYTWMGLPVTTEIGAINPDAKRVQILTIRYVDRRSGRIAYVNHPDNPDGYR